MQDDYAVIRESGLFRAEWYLAQYLEAGSKILDPLIHYLAFGSRLGHQPNEFFDPSWYLMQNPDVGRAGIDPLVHYISQGSSEGRRPGPRFDPVYYTAKVGLRALGGREPLAHFLASGRTDHFGLDDYCDWIAQFDRLTDDDRTKIAGLIAKMSEPPLISVIMPVYETPDKYLRLAIDSVVSQLYPRWELCIVDDCSPSPHVRHVLDEYKKKDPRIKVRHRVRNGHISAASNDGIELAQGSFLALLDHDDELAEHALFLAANVIIQHPRVDLIYSDEDRIDTRGQRFNPYFKSAWNPELILAQNFFCHLGIYRRSLVERIGGLRSAYDGSQDYDLILRAQRATTPENIRHIPHVLYHWRSIAGSTASNSDDAKPYARNAASDAVADHLTNAGLAGTVVASPHPAFSRVQFALPPRPPVASILVHGGSDEDAQRTVASILATVSYPNFEVVVARPRGGRQSPGSVFSLFRKKRVRTVRVGERAVGPMAANAAAAAAFGEFLCFLEAGVEIADAGWLQELIVHALLPGVGLVGSTICTPKGLVRNAGFFLDRDMIAHDAYVGLRLGVFGEFGYFGRAVLVQDLSAVSGNGLLMARKFFVQHGGFDPKLPEGIYSDVDLCLKMKESGLRVVWTPHARLFDDRQSPHLPAQARARDAMRQRWKSALEQDAYLGPNLSSQARGFALASPPKTFYFWRERPVEDKIDNASKSRAQSAKAPLFDRRPARPQQRRIAFGRVLKRGKPIVDQRSRRLILESGLFNAEWYLAQNADVAAAGGDPLDHYLMHGSPEGRSPNPGFDPAYYRKQYPDVAAAAQEPLVHYIVHGSAEGRRPNRFFDPAAYRRRHADVGASGQDPLLHYLTWSLRATDSASDDRELVEASGLFNSAWYHVKNPDVAAAGKDPLTHYLSIGWMEGRFPNPSFDPTWYLDEYRDVATSHAEPLSHYIKIGSVEGRWPNKFFDPHLYRALHPAISKSGLDPLAHELLTSSLPSEASSVPARTPAISSSGRIDAYRLISASGLFNASWYLSQNPDVGAAGMDALEHYIGNGSREGRAPNPGFDPVWYRDTYPAVEEAKLEPLLHYILEGATKNLRPNRNFDPVDYAARFPEIAQIGIGALAHQLLTRSTTSGRGPGRGDPLRFSDLPEFKLPDLFSLRTLEPAGPIAVVVHLYHNEVWSEMAAAVRNIPKPFDVFVSLVAGVSDSMEAAIKRDFPQAHIFVFPEDRGRDIARFMAFLQTGVLFRYELICKIHSKRSTYVDDGDVWRRQLIDGILGSKQQVKSILSAFRRNPDLGIVVADGNIYSGEDRWSGNEAFLETLLPRVGISSEYKGRSFPGGGMFWMRPLILRSMLGIRVNLSDFELEPMPVNGALGHALERVYGLLCEDAGMKVREWSDIESDNDEPTLKSSTKIHVFAFFLPQFHPISENNTWWGEGFTEWTNVTRAKPFYAEHRQPKLPTDLGFYDLRTPETRLAQAKLAKKYGVDGFCYYYYWFNGRRILDRPLNDVLSSGKPDLPLMICWANEPWSRNWDGLDQDTLLPQTYERGWEKALAKDIAPILNDRRYFRLDGRPMFLVYRARHIKDCKLAMQSLRLALEAQGVVNVHLCAGRVDFPHDEDLPEDPADIGFDSYYEFPPHRVAARLMTPRPSDVEEDSGTIYDYGKTIEAAIQRLSIPFVGRRHRGIMVSFDNTPRRAKRATVFHGATPTNFRRWLRATVLSERPKGGERVIFVNAWNEWAEGATLEPDRDFGRGWLEAVASAIAE